MSVSKMGWVAALVMSSSVAVAAADPMQDMNKACSTQRAAVARFARAHGGDDGFLDRYLRNISTTKASDLARMKAAPPKATPERPQVEIDFVMCAIIAGYPSFIDRRALDGVVETAFAIGTV